MTPQGTHEGLDLWEALSWGSLKGFLQSVFFSRASVCYHGICPTWEAAKLLTQLTCWALLW